MIVRTWHAAATEEGAEAYRQHFTTSVLPELAGVPGHRGAYLLQRDAGGEVAIQVITLWESFDAVRGFAGEDTGTAVVEPAARAALTRFDATVTHYTAVVTTAP